MHKLTSVIMAINLFAYRGKLIIFFDASLKTDIKYYRIESFIVKMDNKLQILKNNNFTC